MQISKLRYTIQILNFRYANMDFFQTPHIQIRFLWKDPVFKYEYLVIFIYPWIQLQAIAFESTRHQVVSCLKALPILMAIAKQALACTSRIVFYSLSSEQSFSKRHFIPCQLKCGWGLLKSWRNWFHRKFESLKMKTGAVALLVINLSWNSGISDRVSPFILWQTI